MLFIIKLNNILKKWEEDEIHHNNLKIKITNKIVIFI